MTLLMPQMTLLYFHCLFVCYSALVVVFGVGWGGWVVLSFGYSMFIHSNNQNELLQDIWYNPNLDSQTPNSLLTCQG